MNQQRRSRVAARLVAMAAGAVLLALTLGAPAWAHVTVNPQTATQGGYAKLTFRVPTEMDNASTTKLQIFFPTEHPVASVSVQPHPGWSFAVKTAKLPTPVDGVAQAVTEITWTADSAGAAIKPGEFDEFAISLGPLPKTDAMQFKALQTYSNGQIVRWIDSRAPGQSEPAHPAPVLKLIATGAQAPGASAAPSPAGGEGRATAALVLAIVAVLLSLAAGSVAVLKRRRF